MGPRMREDNGWGMGAPLTTLQGRMQLGTGFTPILTFPHQGGREGKEGGGVGGGHGYSAVMPPSMTISLPVM